MTNIGVEASKSAAIRHALERAGKSVCIGCGIELQTEAKWPRCKPCSKRHKEQCKESTAARRSRDWHRAHVTGLCPNYCGEPVVPGRLLCEKHLAKQREAVRRYKLAHPDRVRETNRQTKLRARQRALKQKREPGT